VDAATLTNLSQLANGPGYAPLASPTFTGIPASPTAAADTNTTQIATTAFVLGQAGSASPLMNGTAAVGTSLRYTRQDHVHPTDTSRAPTASPTFTGTVTASTIDGPSGNSISIATSAAASIFLGHATATVFCDSPLRQRNNLVVFAPNTATSGAPLQNSYNLEFDYAYWNGAGSTVATGFQLVAAPSSAALNKGDLSFLDSNAHTERMRLVLAATASSSVAGWICSPQERSRSVRPRPRA
jgi:hypothetical protein